MDSSCRELMVVFADGEPHAVLWTLYLALRIHTRQIDLDASLTADLDIESFEPLQHLLSQILLVFH
jgi:hypothetical protein